MASDVRFARNGDIQLAYRIYDGGEPAIMFVMPWFSNSISRPLPGQVYSATDQWA